LRKLLYKTILLVNLFVLLLVEPGLAQMENDPVQYVDPNIGTAHCRWFHYTPGALPFGMAKPAPSTNGSYGNAHGWDATGYDTRHTSIEGFPNFHEFQVGGIVFMATTGKLETTPGKLENPDEGYRSRFDKKDQIATAGYYSVILKDYKVKAELTSTKRVAFHRYTFPSGNESHILFDIGNKQGESGAVQDAKVYMTDDGRIEGFVTTLPVYVQKYQPGALVSMYFSAVVSKKPDAVGVFNGKQIVAGKKETTGIGSGMYLSFSTDDNEAITIKAGLSYTSIANARLNLETEATDLSFDEAKSRAHKIWQDYLSRISVESNVKANKVKFYTGLYHALLGRGLCSDNNGAYPKNDGSIGQIALDKNHQPEHSHYNTDAIWGAYWNLTQLWALAYPEYYSDFIKSQLLVYKDAGWLGDGIANSRYVSGVGTDMVSLVIAAGYNIGIRDFDIKQGYEASRKNELEWKDRPKGAGKLDVDRFLKYGFVNHLDKGSGGGETWQYSASHTLEYAFSASAMAQWAKALKKDGDYKEFSRLSKAWEHIYDPSLKLIRPKTADGKFINNFDPSQPWRGFQEGNSWQYTYFVPHDPRRLISLIGSKVFNDRLDSSLAVSEKAMFGGGANIDAFAGIAGIYNHGNQPNLHVSWLFNFSGKPSLTQKWVRSICNEFYGTEDIHGYGFGQDEDQGQLGAWYVMAAMGLFDVSGLSSPDPQFGISSPLFDKITIILNPKYYSGKQFIIDSKNSGGGNNYIRSINLNGKSIHTPFIDFKTVTNGGNLQLSMGKEPVDKY